MVEEGEKKVSVNQGVEKLRTFMSPGEVWITNSIDGEYAKKNGILLSENEQSGQQFASELLSYRDKGGKWDTVRVVDHAFDIHGKPLEGMVALVGTPKETQ